MEIVAAAAPRPMLLVAATGDWTVNTPRIEFPAVRSIYELFGAAERLECVQIDAGHNFNRDSREVVYGFFARYLGGRGEPAPRPASAVFWSGASEPVREAPDLAVEAPAALRVFPDETPLPAGALPDAAAVAGSLADRAARRLQADRPSGAESLERYRRIYGPVFQAALAAEVPAPADLVLEHRSPEAHPGFTLERLLIGTKRHGERLPAIFISPPGAVAAPPGGGRAQARGVPALLVDAGGNERWFERPPDEGPAGVVLGPLASGLLRGGRSVLLVEPFLTGAYRSPLGATGRPVCESHFAGYNRVDAAWRVQDVLTAAGALRGLTGVREVDALGRGDAGLWCLLARGVDPEVFRSLIADLGTFRWDDDREYLARLCVPHLLRAGGLATAVALAAPAPLLLYNAGEHVPAWIGALYDSLGAGDALAIEPGALPEAALAG
jgi:hypothetical protein